MRSNTDKILQYALLFDTFDLFMKKSNHRCGDFHFLLFYVNISETKLIYVLQLLLLHLWCIIALLLLKQNNDAV